MVRNLAETFHLEVPHNEFMLILLKVNCNSTGVSLRLCGFYWFVLGEKKAMSTFLKRTLSYFKLMDFIYIFVCRFFRTLKAFKGRWNWHVIPGQIEGIRLNITCNNKIDLISYHSLIATSKNFLAFNKLSWCEQIELIWAV